MFEWTSLATSCSRRISQIAHSPAPLCLHGFFQTLSPSISKAYSQLFPHTSVYKDKKKYVCQLANEAACLRKTKRRTRRMKKKVAIALRLLLLHFRLPSELLLQSQRAASYMYVVIDSLSCSSYFSFSTRSLLLPPLLLLLNVRTYVHTRERDEM